MMGIIKRLGIDSDEGKHIFKYISRQDLEEMLTAFHAVTKLNITLISAGEEIIESWGEQYDFCRQYEEAGGPEAGCILEQARAGQMAMEFGEVYVFGCHCGLNHIVYPIVVKGQQFGSVLAGPFRMDEAEEDFLEGMEIAENVSAEQQRELLQSVRFIPVFAPAKVTQISILFRYLCRSVLVESRDMIAANNGKLLQQSRINESIQLYKNSGVRDSRKYPVDLENEVISAVKANDQEKAREKLNDLLGHILLYEGHDIIKVRYRIVELCSLLSRASINRGADPEQMLDLNRDLISSVMGARNIYDVCYRLQDNFEIFTDNLFQSTEHRSRVVKNAVEYIARNFSEEITLTSAAEELHVNASYLSMLFRQVTGMTFKEHLNHVRIEEAERLLANTNYPILEIAIACGYRDQSYFTKVFKKYTGLTPRQYR